MSTSGRVSLGGRAKVQPDKRPGDSPPGVKWVTDDLLEIWCKTDGRTERITLSARNAWQLFGLLALMLGLPLSKKLGKMIHLDLGE